MQLLNTPSTVLAVLSLIAMPVIHASPTAIPTRATTIQPHEPTITPFPSKYNSTQVPTIDYTPFSGINPYLLPRGDWITTMKGKCTGNGLCKVPHGIKKGYKCRHSECRPEDKGTPCVLARDEIGNFVGKCPVNLLPYEWDWPWVAPKTMT